MTRTPVHIELYVSSFDPCLEGCDCGAQLQLGVSAPALLRLVSALQQAGLTLAAVPPPARPEDLFEGMSDAFAKSMQRAFQGQQESAKASRAAKALLDRYLIAHGAPPAT